MTTQQPTTNDADEVKLTKREEAHVKELERLAKSLEETNLLYGSALDGMAPGLQAASQKLADTDLSATMAAAEGDIMHRAQDVIRQDIEEMTAIGRELDEDDAEEEALLAEDEAGAA